MRNWNKFAVALFVTVVCLALIFSQAPDQSAAGGPAAPLSTQESSPVVLIALPWDDPTIRIPPPRQFAMARAPTATFSINYLPAGTSDGQGATCLAWNPSAQAAFSHAASIWGTLINSAVPIRINACWANLGSSSMLGYAWSNMVRDFSGASRPGTWYVYSLADALHGGDLDPSRPDFYTTYNSGFSWYFGTDGMTPAGQVDFVTVVMHEIGHGLNFAGTMRYGTTSCGGANFGCWGFGSGYPGIYDRFTENGAGQALLNTSIFLNPSAALGAALTSNNLYFNGPNANAANGGTRVKIYAPATWASGSSYSHLDYDTFRNTPNRLMVYAISSGSSIHNPGPVGMGLLKDLGWTTPTTGANTVYLPFILKSATSQMQGIYGRVTHGGAAASGVPLDLRFYNGSTWSTYATTTTGSDGNYSFTGMPSLVSGQSYYVRYLNTSGTTGRLWFWSTRALASYTAGSAVAIGDFDIADVSMVSPPHGATVALPHTFQWTPRPATPTDSYEFNLFDPSDRNPWWWTNPALGYVSNYTLTSLPTGFSPSTQYVWTLWVYGPDGGYGESYYYRTVTFSNAGSGATLPLFALPKRVNEDLLPMPRQQK